MNCRSNQDEFILPASVTDGLVGKQGKVTVIQGVSTGIYVGILI